MIAETILGMQRDVFLTVFGLLVGAIIGFPIGLRTNYIIGRAFEYRAFLNQAMVEVRLVSEKLKKGSYDYSRVPRADQAVRLFADQIEHLGQKSVAIALRGIAGELATKFDSAREHGRFRVQRDGTVDSEDAILKVDWRACFIYGAQA